MESLKIKFKKAHRDYAYFSGDFATLPANVVADLVESGHVILFPGDDDTEPNPLPEDLPARDLLFANGFTTLDQIIAAGESITEIKGIGRKSSDLIIQYYTPGPESL